MEGKKIIRRTTRNKTQFIDFNKEEIANIRLEINNLEKDEQVNKNEKIKFYQDPILEKKDRTFQFKDLLEWVHKKEKRELFPKNKFDYVYKKNKNTTDYIKEDYNEEKNIIHMRIEEDIIPRLCDNPFIQADKYFKNKK